MLPSPPPPAGYCLHCGAPLRPGVAHCDVCRMPVVSAPAVIAPTVAARAYPSPPPAYAYPPAPRAAYPARQFRLSQAMVAGGLIAVLIVVAAVISAFAVNQFTNATHTTCTSNCAPKFVLPLAEEASYKSSAYNFQVNYSSEWTVRSQDASGITLSTKVGFVQVAGMSGSSPDQALQSTVNALPSSRYQDVALVSDLKGAHIGDQNGVGAVYSANFVGTSQTAVRVRFAVIAATRRGVTVVVFAVDPADPKGSPYGMPEGQQIDYMCTELAWG